MSAPIAAEPSPNVRFGMPSAAKDDPKQRDDYLIERPQYTLSYNDKTHCPNWVAWASCAGPTSARHSRVPFEPDPLLPKGFARVTSNTYNGSGFDRGHMPAHDRSADQKDIEATSFYLTNIVPQSPNSNQKGWDVRSYCRELTHKGHVLYIICGPHRCCDGTGKDGPKDEIGKGKVYVTVPAKVWKVILVLPNEDAEPRNKTRVIAVVMPNDQSVGFDWRKYRCSVKHIEKLTGYKFFANLPGALVAEPGARGWMMTRYRRSSPSNEWSNT